MNTNKQTNKVIRIFLKILFIFSIIITIFYTYRFLKLQIICDIKTKGVVVQVDTMGLRDPVRYYSTVEYVDLKETKHRLKSPYSFDINRYQVNDTVGILYDINNPSYAYIEGDKRVGIRHIVLCYFMSGILLYGFKFF